MKGKLIKNIFIAIFLFIGLILFRLVGWLHSYFGDLSVEKIIFHINVPLEGTDSKVVILGLMYVLIPSFLIALFVYSILAYNDKVGSIKKTVESKMKTSKFLPIKHIKKIVFVSTLIIMSMAISTFNLYFGVVKYIKAQSINSSFIKEHYVEPNNDIIKFPKKKRNLIYIYLESIESTFADVSAGGAYKDNYIPELTELAKENINFSNTNKLGGYQAVTGTGWTMAGMFSQSTGVSLKLPVEGNSMSEYSEFFPGVISIGDVLAENGYKNYLMLGSDSKFGGRRNFFQQHGDYEIFDYFTAKDKGLIPEDYHVFWGFEDEKLFQFAKDELLDISSKEEPFNFTMLTVDTHAQEGYLCDLCRNDYDSQLANVIACSSRQVNDFLTWIKEQDFYEDTTIVLAGDHRTMNPNFVKDIGPDYQRTVYNCFINTVMDVNLGDFKMTNRKFSSLDLFPTTLASIGVKINGDKLGLGVNLFSDKNTLLEEYGNSLMDYLAMRSEFYNKNFIYSK
ncbi:MAG: sulfatase-like hydrolase/transferase [Firmicutes bacterium]|nr:sulfatase-like hydrolase/transferase [Bacillota bacterium]